MRRTIPFCRETARAATAAPTVDPLPNDGASLRGNVIRADTDAAADVTRVSFPGGEARTEPSSSSIQNMPGRNKMMKRLMFLAVVAAMLSFNSGCYLLDRVFNCHHGCGAGHGGSAACDSCESCGGGCATGNCGSGCASCGLGQHGGRGDYASGPDDSMGGMVSYPYYTTRGPRDFLAKSPRSIGP